MRNLFLICTMMCMFGYMTTTAQEYNFEDYVYPFGCRTFSSQNTEGMATSMSQFSFASESFDNYLIEEVYVGMGIMSAKNIYRYYIENNAVISDVQLRQNALTGSTKYQDKITLFAFPNNDKPYTWTETDRGDKISGKSEYVYVMFNSQRTRAIKITKTITFITNDNVKHKQIEKSFWIKGYGRVVTYYSIDGSEDRIQSIIELPVYFDGVTELPSQGM